MSQRRRQLRIQGAHAHNLRSLDLEIPHDRLTVITGISGSGKSSLAFDVLYQECQRRFLETVAPQARLYLDRLDAPAVERVEGLRAAVALHQGRGVRNPRSTVATLSGLGPLMRLLWARLGRLSCPACGTEAGAVSVEQLCDLLYERFQSRKVALLAPLVEGHRGVPRPQLAAAWRRGCRELWLDGSWQALHEDTRVPGDRVHSAAALVARLDPGEVARTQLLHEVSRALALGREVLWVQGALDGAPERFSLERACRDCGAGLPALGPRLFSFNSPFGACPHCEGLGVEDRIDPSLLVADPRKSLRQGALVPTTRQGYIVYSQVTMEVLDRICRAHGFDVDTPWEQLTEEQRGVVLYGSTRLKVPFGKHPLSSRLKWSGITARPREEGHYRGIVTTLEEILGRKRNPGVLRFARTEPCRACGGSRLNPAARSVRLHGITLPEQSRRSIAALGRFCEALDLSERQRIQAEGPLSEMTARVRHLSDLSLGHLPLDRPAPRLSPGEVQRLRLGGLLAGDLRGLLYVLDEPSAGLHPRETARLVQALLRLRDRGNTVVVVEHDPQVVREADVVVDLGPGAGSRGGRLLYRGPPEDWPETADSPTRRLLAAPPPARRASPPVPEGAGVLHLRGAPLPGGRRRDIDFVLGGINVVSGPSGSGGSQLLSDTLAPLLEARLEGRTAPGEARLEGGEALRRLVTVDAAPIGRNPRSNAATYTRLFDRIRALFAQQPEAEALGLGANHFSFNRPGGRCETCQGAGSLKVGMHFLPDLHRRCPDCRGRRFHERCLRVRYHGHDIHQVLGLEVDRAREVFAEDAGARRVLEALSTLGLGYLPLGQPSTTLSGGEARRIKLARELARPARRPTLFLLDAPATGLHTADLDGLLHGLRQLCGQGHTVVMADSHPLLVAEADQGVTLYAPAELEPAPQAETPPQSEKEPGKESFLELDGVRTHNLRGISARFPAGRLSVIRGVSGCGKSSLAFDTLHAEAWRRFARSLPTQARRFLGRLPAPALEEARGLLPTVAVRQRDLSRHFRSTVATAGGIHPLLRLLYARAGQVHCPRCEIPASEGHCPRCHRPLPLRLSASAFSFNHSEGACTACEGSGVALRADAPLLVRHPERSLWEGALGDTVAGRLLGDPEGRHLALLDHVGRALGLSLRRPWRDLTPEARRVALEGTGDRTWRVDWHYKRGKREGVQPLEGPWPGLLRLVEQEWEAHRTSNRGKRWKALLREIPCPACDGTRLQSVPACVQLYGSTLPEVLTLHLDGLRQRLDRWSRDAAGARRDVLETLLPELLRRLDRTSALGLGHLGLDRPTATLSGGEARRLQLAAHLDSGLQNLCFVLDEPCTGLHPRDVRSLLAVVEQLVAGGNTVVAVEHEPAFLSAAHWCLELGPGAGPEGGHVVYAGPADLRPLPQVTAPDSGPPPVRTRALQVQGARAHNLRHLDLEIPAGLVTLCGVSGSGKTSLLRDVVAASARAGHPVGCEAIRGLDRFRRWRWVDRTPLGNHPGSTPATFLDWMDPLRRLFARTEQARALGLGPAAFSHLSPSGRCPACKGMGQKKVSMDFLADLWLPCETCGGRRYRPESLQVRWRGYTIARLLASTVGEAAALCSDHPRLSRELTTLEALGLDYLPLGQPIPTLSGGEAQRLRLAAALCKGGDTAPELFLLDEPSAGLHPRDVSALLALLRRLCHQGHGVVVTSHDLDLVAHSDHVLELGPEGGPEGGSLVFSGSPAELAAFEPSPTGRALRERTPGPPDG